LKHCQYLKIISVVSKTGFPLVPHGFELPFHGHHSSKRANSHSGQSHKLEDADEREHKP
jgi:hypothetical protein